MATTPAVHTAALNALGERALAAKIALAEVLAYHLVDQERALRALATADESLSEAIMAAGDLDHDPAR